MSKCDISIKFDRPDRTYRGGETVSGEVHVQVNKDITSDGIHLTSFWKTHGYGNTDGGGDHSETLADKSQLTAGQTMTFPFSFVADRQPMTYHGHHINVDHYGKVAVDVPWAFDPKAEEEFILVPGKRPPEMTGKRDEIIDFTPETPTQFGAGCMMVIYVFAAVMLLMVVGAFIWLLPIVLLVLGGIWVRKKMLASRLGEVELKTPHLLVGAGEDWPVELKFTAKKTCQINGIQVKFRCWESATSGSGTNKTTRKHTVLEKVHSLESAMQLTAGELFEKSYSVPFPQGSPGWGPTRAYSLDEGSNDIVWTAQVRIDIPVFPDWTNKQTVQFLPAEFFDDDGTEQAESEPVAATPDPARSTSDPVDEAPDPWLAEAPSDFSAAPPSTEAPAAVPDPTTAPSQSSPILPLVEQIRAADRFGDERERIVESWSDRELDITVEIDRVSSTFSSDAAEAYRNGWTVTGTVSGTEQAIEVLTPADRSVDGLGRGEQWPTRIVVSKWDSLYNRISALDVTGQ